MARVSNRRRQIDSTQIQAELEKLKGLLDGRAKCLKTTVKITKRKETSNISRMPKRKETSNISSMPKRKETSNISKMPMPKRKTLLQGLSAYFLFEFASGYALFYAHGVDDLQLSSFDAHEKYINSSDQTFTLKAFHPFSSTDDALVQMNALNTLSNSTLTPLLKRFLVDNLPKRMHGKGSSCFVATSNPSLAHNITYQLGLATTSGAFTFNLMRGLRMKIDKFIDGLEPECLIKQQQNLARLYSKQICTTMVAKTSKAISSSSLQQLVDVPRGRKRSTSMVVKTSKAIVPYSSQQYVVVPHKFEGVFIAKGKEDDLVCTRNLVSGEALCGEELLYIQNDDGTEAEYRVWNPLRSKLAAAILCGVKNICVIPGSRVLYLGDVCDITVSYLSDLVGSDGLVYVVGFSDVVVNMVEKRPNVITILEKPNRCWKYRMVLGMVDVIFADIAYPINYYYEVNWIVSNARFYLRAGGHYMISTQANNIGSTSKGKDFFANIYERGEFNPVELVMLEPIVREYVMAIGGFRVPEE